MSWDQRVTIQIDFALGVVFLLHAALRSHHDTRVMLILVTRGTMIHLARYT